MAKEAGPRETQMRREREERYEASQAAKKTAKKPAKKPARKPKPE